MLDLFKKYPQLLSFGILTAMFSGPGQTFLVSVFIPPMRDQFRLSQTEIASLYSFATLGSAILLPWIGRMFDKISLIRFTMTAGILLALGCLVLSQSVGPLTILIGFLLVRNLGQGTLTMISSTTMAKVFGAYRGKALAISNLGYPLSEAVFPLLISSWIAAYGWRSGWIFLSALTLLFFSPVAFLLVRKNPHTAASERIASETLELEKNVQAVPEIKDWKVREMLGDKRFYFSLIAMLIPPAYLTALFFHQGSFLSAWKGWDMKLLSSGFVIYAAVRIGMAFFIGPAIDRISARRVFPWSLLPLAVGMGFLLGGDSPFWYLAYLVGAGASIGLTMTVMGALYAEFYGTKHLGAIRGLTGSILVFSTAVAPTAMGMLLDSNIALPPIIMTMIVFALLGTLLSFAACRKSL